MKPPRFLPAALLICALSWLTACSTPTATRHAKALPGVTITPCTPPDGLPELGKLTITTAFQESNLRIQTPPPKGKAMRKAFEQGKDRFYVPPVRDFHAPPVSDMGSALVVGTVYVGVGAAYGSFQGLSALVGATTGACRSIGGGLSGIPAAEHKIASQAISKAIAERPLPSSVTRRILEPNGESFSSVVQASNRTGPADTILELYDGERSLLSGGGVNPVMHLEIGYRCTLIRARDQKALHVFRVNYTSSGHKFVEWGANDAELFQEEMDKALSSLAGQIRAQLERIEANAVQTPPSQLARSQTN